MELSEHEILKLIQDRMVIKLYSHDTLVDFISWVKSITGPNFKAFAVACITEVLGGRDAVETTLLEAKASIEE